MSIPECNLTGRRSTIKRLPVKAGTHRWMSEGFGETRTRSGTNMFGVFSCVGSFQSWADVVGSDWACKVWGGGPSDVCAIGFSDWLCASWMAILIGSVRANQRSVWEGWNTVWALFFYALCSVISCFHVFMFCSTGTRLVVMSVQDELIWACCMFSMQLFLSEIIQFCFDRK